MKLGLQQIQSITLGACLVQETENGFHFYRYTQQQMQMLSQRKSNAPRISVCTSGVSLRFRTDSRHLTVAATMTKCCSRNYYAMDLLVNGSYRDCLRNFDDTEMVGAYVAAVCPMGDARKTFELEAGEKELELLLPWSCEAVLTEISIDDGAALIPVKPARTLLAFGDSITQGYDALNPHRKYVTQLAHYLDAQEYNKGFGGEIFWPELAATREEFQPDYILVAYGTNDWSKCLREDIEANCTGFYKNLAENYPDSKILALTPLWRKNMDLDKPAGLFTDIAEIIRRATEPYANITVISGMDLIPHDTANFADLNLHPNDRGFDRYFESLKGLLN